MANIGFNYFTPAAFVPATDLELMQYAKDITDAGKKEERLDAIGLGMKAIAQSVLVNVPYHLICGAWNAIDLFSDKPILSHYQDALCNLLFGALSVVYVAAGIFYLPAFEYFTAAAEVISNPPQKEEISDLNPIIQGSETPKKKMPSLVAVIFYMALIKKAGNVSEKQKVQLWGLALLLSSRFKKALLTPK